jgi:dephospho-CoA kinase
LIFVGLTGGIGSGKSEALAACRRLGAATLSSDEVVHELLGTQEVRDLLAERWGSNALSREEIAEIVFDKPDELAWLEGVLFPRVGQRMAAWRAGLESSEDGPDVAVVEVPLLFEAGVDGAFDATIAIVADENLREERASARGHRGVEGREARQLSQDEKAGRADFIVQNDGTLEDLEAAMGRLLQRLKASR